MNFKHLAFLICPPVVFKLVARLGRGGAIHQSYADALKACGSGYDSDVIANVVVEKNLVIRAAVEAGRGEFDMSALRALSAAIPSVEHDTINVLDFGGGGGYHYFFFKAALAGKRKVRWCVAETPQMVAAAKPLENDELFFADSVEAAAERLGRVDLVLICGSLQYTPEPLAFLDRLMAIGADQLFITRIPLIKSESSVVMVQSSWLSSNGPGPLPVGTQDYEIKYPVTILSQTMLELALAREYATQLKLTEEPTAYFVDGVAVGNYGYLCLKKSD